MNGNDYLIIRENNEENIIDAYTQSINDIDDVPEEFITHWIDMYLENGREEE